MWKQIIAGAIALLLSVAARPVWNDGGNVYTHGSREDAAIALTFDDGPHPVYTDRILDVLERYGVKATFFPIGINAENYPAPLLRAYKEGHEIGNHTYHHKNLRTLSYEEMVCEIGDTARRIYDMTDYPVTLIRPPQGIMSAQFLSLTEELGYRVVLWDVDTRDWAGESVTAMTRNILENTDNVDFILFHDYHNGAANTIRTLEIVIPELQKRGFRFVTVSELLDD